MPYSLTLIRGFATPKPPPLPTLPPQSPQNHFIFARLHLTTGTSTPSPQAPPSPSTLISRSFPHARIRSPAPLLRLRPQYPVPFAHQGKYILCVQSCACLKSNSALAFHARLPKNKLLLALLAHPPNTLSPLPDPHKHPSHNCLCHRCNSCILNPLTITVTLTTALPHQPPCRCIATIATTVPAPPYRHGATKATTATTVPPFSCPCYLPNARLSIATRLY